MGSEEGVNKSRTPSRGRSRADAEAPREGPSDGPAGTGEEDGVPAPAASKAKSSTRKRPMMSETVRELKMANKELLVHIKELELERVAAFAGPDEGEGPDYADTSEESGIIAMVKDLHREIDLAHELKEALEYFSKLSKVKTNNIKHFDRIEGLTISD